MNDDRWIDFDGDGNPDEYEVYETEDGTAYVHYDEDGQVDAVAIDEEDDGYSEELYTDSDGDGTLDTHQVDTDGDGFMDESEAMEDPYVFGEEEPEDGGSEGFIGGSVLDAGFGGGEDEADQNLLNGHYGGEGDVNPFLTG